MRIILAVLLLAATAHAAGMASAQRADAITPAPTPSETAEPSATPAPEMDSRKPTTPFARKA